MLYKVGEQMQLDSNNHSVLLIYYYLVFVAKYRCKVIEAIRKYIES